MGDGRASLPLLRVQRPRISIATALVRERTEVDPLRMATVIHPQLDLQGAPWQLTLRRVSNTVCELAPGALIEVLATDPESVREFAAWSRATGNALLESSQFGTVFRFVIRKL
jgi:tRNA 2-thiouridine synthesizing protein A